MMSRRLSSLRIVSLSVSLSFLLARLVTISFGFVLVSFAASAKNYEIGSVYTYDYILGLELNEPSTGSESVSTVGYKILSQVIVRPVWQQEPGGSIFEIKLIKPKLQIKSRKAPQPEGFWDHTSHLDTTTLHPLYVYWKDGQVQKTFSVKNDDTSLVNIKKGIANLLQNNPNGGSAEEETPAGRCQVLYENKDHFHVKKTVTGRCIPGPEANYPFSSSTNPVLGTTVESNINAEITLTKDNSVLQEAEVTETHIVRVNAKQEVGATVLASQSFKLAGTSSSGDRIITASSADSAIEELSKSEGITLVQDGLLPKPEHIPYCEAINCKTYDVLLKTLEVENMATTKASSAFIQLVAKIREAKHQELKALLQPSSPHFPQLLDACAAAGTEDAHKTAMSALNFFLEDDYAHPERYLLGLSLASSPSEEILTGINNISLIQIKHFVDLFKLLRREEVPAKLHESLTLTTAAVARTLKEKADKYSSSVKRSLLHDVEEYLVNSLSYCSQKEENEEKMKCQILYLRALKNLKSKTTVSILFEFIQNSKDSKVSVVAMKSIHAMPDAFIETRYRPQLLRIIQQLGRKYDSSVRTMALDLILRNKPTKLEISEIVGQLLKKIVDRQHSEVTTFMWNRIHEFMEHNAELQTMLNAVILEERLKNYHHLSPLGLSTAFSRVFSKTPSANSTFSNAIEMTGKILKRSSFDVFIQSMNDSLSLFSLGIFAGGLSSFAAENNNGGANVVEVEDDTEDATAGMELSLMGVQQRPIVFFVGNSELMGLVWSGAGSERTTALQGNVLLQDEKRTIPLFNGLLAEVTIQGGLSFDLAGQIQISLWHRTANSLVENKAGLVLQSVVRADTSFVRSKVDYTVAAEAALHFTSDINFYDGVLMCLKLTQPEFSIRQNIHKTERIPGSKHKLRKAKYKTIPVPGITYALNKKNSQLCGVMYKDEL
ncbi:Microsomal triglyceride transfer protein large subunit [Orchesella cincta]|uniref:Microsomal triglyceride transfer protein large subunit n=1 Tax=Orchesella cincta TaxID=48709 RepID=A0A1D2N0K7_ORCCI|nr:Microsomal triglyceride transfer protein large subunit [Orchesella cincta]